MPLLVLALVLSASTAASAQAPPRPPDFVDHDDAPPGGNLQKVWFDPTAEGLWFTLEIEALREPQRDHYYLVAFTIDGVRSMAGIGWDASGGLHTYAGPTSAGRGGQPIEDFANARLREAEISSGSPAYVRGLLAYGAIEGLEPGAELRDLHAGVTRLDREERAWQDVDPHPTRLALRIPQQFAQPQGATDRFSLPDVSLPDLPRVPSWAIAAVGAVAGAVGGAYAGMHFAPRLLGSAWTAPAWRGPAMLARLFAGSRGAT